MVSKIKIKESLKVTDGNAKEILKIIKTADSKIAKIYFSYPKRKRIGVNALFRISQITKGFGVKCRRRGNKEICYIDKGHPYTNTILFDFTTELESFIEYRQQNTSLILRNCSIIDLTSTPERKASETSRPIASN